MKKGSRINLVVAIIVIIAVVGWILYQKNVLPIHQTVDIPSSFDNKADSQLIKLGVNAEYVSKDQLPELMKGAIGAVEAGKYPSANILFPFTSIGNHEIKEVVDRAYGSDPITGESNKLLTGGRSFFFPNKGPKIVVPVENAEIFRVMYDSDPSSSTNTSQFQEIVIRFNGPDGIKHEIIIGADKRSQMLPTEILNNAPTIGTKNGMYPYLDKKSINLKGLPLPIGTILASVAEDNSLIFVGYVSSTEKISTLPYKPDAISSEYGLASIQDSNGNEKVAVLSSN